MTVANAGHILEQSVGDVELTVVEESDHIDWAAAPANTRTLLGLDFDSSWVTAALNPTFAAEVAAAHEGGDAYTLAVDGAPWELRGTLWVREGGGVKSGYLRVFVPEGTDTVDWGGDVAATRNVIQATMNGTDPWEIQLNPAFRDDLRGGLQAEAKEHDEEGEAVVQIVIDDESPWRIKYGQLTVDNEDGEWVVRSTPLMIAADELDWAFSFEGWEEE